MNSGFALREKGKRKAGVAGAAFRLSALHPTHEALRCAVRLCSHRAAAVTAQGSQTERTGTNALLSALFTSGVACPPAASPSVSASHGQAPSGTAPSRAPSRAPQEGPELSHFAVLFCRRPGAGSPLTAQRRTRAFPEAEAAEASVALELLTTRLIMLHRPAASCKFSSKKPCSSTSGVK